MTCLMRREIPGRIAGLVPLALLVAAFAPALPLAAEESRPEAVEFDDRLGEVVSGEIEVIDEDGRPVPLASLVDRPTILSLVYYECPGICTPLLTEVADILGKTSLDPREQPFQLLTVSFDPTDTPLLAAKKRRNYLAQLNRPYPESTWRFFTASPENIEALTEAVGFRYKTVGDEFIHPGGLIILSPERKIVRYLYGTQFLPFDFKMGVIEAARGKVTPTTARILRFCFSYDPEGRTYAFNIARVVGSVMIVSLLFFGGFLYISTRAYRRRKG